MHTNRSTLALFAIIVLEGYVVLSSELLAIRLTVPFVGSGTDTVSVIIAAVLMPLAFGYHSGGRFKAGHHKTFSGFITGETRYVSVREKLIFNMMASLGFLIFALSYGFLHTLFPTLIKLGVTNRILITTIYSVIFIAPPVYMLGQTIPLICNFFTRERLSKITGRILFFSTLGSFLGAVFSTLVLMATIGVNNTAIINFVILAALVMVLNKNLFDIRIALSWAIAFAGILTNTDSALKQFYIVENNQYNTIAVLDVRGQRHLFMNRNPSSMYDDEGNKHAYIEFMEKIAIEPVWESEEPKNILVIGAGAFTLGAEDDFHLYDYLDIDKSLKDIAEQRILKKPLGDNKTFHPVPARAYLTQTEQKYDVIIIDAYRGALTLPEHLMTREFFQQVKAALKPHGKLLSNMAMSPNFLSPLSRHVDNTLRSVFPHVSRHIIGDRYELWGADPNYIANVIYIYNNNEDEDSKTIYTDIKNDSFKDRPQKQYR